MTLNLNSKRNSLMGIIALVIASLVVVAFTTINTAEEGTAENAATSAMEASDRW